MKEEKKEPTEKKRGRPAKKTYYVGFQYNWGKAIKLKSFIYECYGDVKYDKLMEHIQKIYNTLEFCIMKVEEIK